MTPIQPKYQDVEQEINVLTPVVSPTPPGPPPTRRWFGLAIVAILNFMTAFSIILYAPIADITRQYFGLSSLTPVNWIYISAMFIYVAVSPVSITITRYGTRSALLSGAGLLILGSWCRYLGARIGSFEWVLVGSVLCGASQPFALNIAAHYSDIWFSESGRLTATALMSLANPLGQAVASLVIPFMATKVEEVPRMSLYVAIMFTGSTALTIFTPRSPPGHVVESVDVRVAIRRIARNKILFCIMAPVSIYIGLFNALATLIEQITAPYGFTDIKAGILGAILVVLGLIASAVTSPILDKTRAYKVPLGLAVSALTLSYFVLLFVVRKYSTGTFIALITMMAIIGSASLITLPLALELAADVTFPIAPEVSSSILWMGGQLLSGIVIIVMDALRNSKGYYTNSLIFMVIVAVIPVPFVVALLRSRRIEECRSARNGLIRTVSETDDV